MQHLVETSQPVLRPTTIQDYSPVAKLLEKANLPVAGVEDNFENFLVLLDDDRIIGAVGLEVYGQKALLRSMVVAKAHQRKGHGKRLCETVLRNARDQQLVEIYLLTETAERFFAAQGFEAIDRELVDEGVRSAEEFRSLCPSTATCMRLNLI